MLGLPFSFAHHFAAGNTEPAVAAYRAAFRPSDDLDEPYVMLGVVGRVRRDRRARPGGWPGSGALAFLRLRSGRPGRYPTPEEAAEYTFTPARARGDQGVDRLAHRRRSRGRCAAALAELAERTGADELMITTLTHSRRRPAVAPTASSPRPPVCAARTPPQVDLCLGARMPVRFPGGYPRPEELQWLT